MDWVSFEEVKKVVTLQVAIDHYHIPLRRINSHTLRGKCPLPSHRSEKSGDSFTATLNKGVGGAWACQSQSCVKARGRAGGNVLDFVAAMEQCSVRDAAIKLQMWFLVPAAGESSGDDRKEPQPDTRADKKLEKKLISGESTSDAIACNKPLAFELQRIDHLHPYLAERGITETIARTFGVGVFTGKGSMSGRCVIPIHNRRGELLAYAGRAIDGSEPRYKFPAGFRKSLELFNLHRAIGELSVVLVEGFFDCMKVTQAGFSCIALMGSAMSKTQEDLLAEYFAHVIVMMDGDEAGRTAAEEIIDRLRHVAYQVEGVVVPCGAQPDQLRQDELHELLDRMYR